MSNTVTTTFSDGSVVTHSAGTTVGEMTEAEYKAVVARLQSTGAIRQQVTLQPGQGNYFSFSFDTSGGGNANAANAAEQKEEQDMDE